MKRSFGILASAIAAVAMLGACQKEQINRQDNNSEQNISESFGTFTVSADYTEPVTGTSTKTALVDVDNPYVKWLSTDRINMWEFVDGTENACFHTAQGGTHLSDNDKSATFDISLNGTDPEGSTYCYTAIYPEGAVTENVGIYSFEIPATQTLVNGNFAANADILIGKPVTQASRISSGTNISVQFKRPGTAVGLTLKGITAGEKITSIKITAPDGQKIAGRCKIDLTTGEVSDKAYENGTNEITLNCGNIAATGNDVFYFRCLDGTWASGSNVSIRVETNNAIYTKTVSLPKDYVFADGGLTKFGFQGMTRDAIISHNSPVGAIGMLDGVEGIVVELPAINSGNAWPAQPAKKVVIATKNIGAEKPEDYGKYYLGEDPVLADYRNKDWYLLNPGDFAALMQMTNKVWYGQGYKWTFSNTNTSLLLPAAGWYAEPQKAGSQGLYYVNYFPEELFGAEQGCLVFTCDKWNIDLIYTGQESNKGSLRLFHAFPQN